MRAAPRYPAGLASHIVGKTDPSVLQDFLASKYSLTRRGAKAVIDGRSVWVNRKCVWIARYSLKPGDSVELPLAVVKSAQRQSATGAPSASAGSVASATASRPGAAHIRVLWQNGNYLVCDKPSGMLSCGDPRSVESRLREQEGLPGLEAVHRLDRDTTGCLAFAKNHAAFEAAVEVFKTHRVSKTYHAIVMGRFKYPRTCIETPIDGESAVTRIYREAVGEDASFLRVGIETGRTNQIRRHLSSIRFPIIGDRVFGLKSVRDPRMMQVPRQMLHSSTLAMPDPMEKGGEIKVHSPLPADFRATLRLFGMGKKG